MSNEERIDEQSRRRPGWRDGAKIELADGQEWTFPRPRVRYVPSDHERGFEVRSGFGPEYDATIVAYDEAVERGDWPGMVGGQMKIAAFLLRLNYDLTTAELQRLLQFEYGPGIEDPIRRAIMDVASGADAPKASTAGSDLLS